MDCNCNIKATTIVRGNDTNFNGADWLIVNLNSPQYDLATFKATFIIGDIVKTIVDLSSGTFTINLTAQETSRLPNFVNATLNIIDNLGRIATATNTIPVKVISIVDNNAIATEPYTLNFDVEQGGETILNVSVESAVTVEVGTTSTLPAGSGATVTNIGTANHLVLDFGIPQGIQGEQGEQGEAGQDGSDATINGVNTLTVNATNGITLTQSGSTATISGASLQGDIAGINELIPEQASTSNQLADKNFVNSSIATNTANFIGTFNSVAELEAYSGTVTNNDYAFVATTDSAGNTLYDRYKYNGSEWLFEYELNNSSFTANQWASINSGATTTNIGQIATNTTAIGDLSSLTTTDQSSLVGAVNEVGGAKMDKLNPSGSGVFTLNGGTALGVNSIAIGENSTAWNDNTFSEGASDNKALDIVTNQDIDNAVNQDSPQTLITAWETDKFTLAGGFASHSEGQNCLALGTNSHAEGNGTIAYKSSAHAEGTGSWATGKYSHAGGLETVASGQGSFAHGQRVRATAGNAIAIGYNETNFADNNATGFCSIAMGRNSIASGEDSVAIGKGLISSDSSRVVVGKYNKDVSGIAFSVGGGGGENSRKNIFYVDTYGKAHIYGDLTSSDDAKTLVDIKYMKEYAQVYLPNQKVLKTSADVNNAKEAGFYRVGFTYNLNGQYTYGEMVSIPYKSTEEGNNNHYGAQLFFANGDYDDGRQNCFWYRTINGTTWNSWIKVDPNAINSAISAKQNSTDNSLNTTSKTIVGAINEVDSIALGANQAIAYADYSAMVTAFNSATDTDYRVGQNIYIATLDVPDLWVSSVESSSVTYTYTTDSAFTTALSTDGYVQVGYYKLRALETQKVDLTNYVQNTDLAGINKMGLAKFSQTYGFNIVGTDSGIPYIYSSDETLIAQKSNAYRPIAPNKLDYAVKVGVTTNANTLTNTEKNNACSWLGTKQIVSLTQADYDALVSGGTVDASTLYIIIEATP